MKLKNSKTAVIGSLSMVGSRFCELFQDKLIKADLNGKIPVNITDPQSVNDFFKNYDFESVILFSAFTDVDAAEKQRNQKNGLCWKINVEGVNNTVDACIKFKKKLVFISTDFVFDGTNGPYFEDDITGSDLNKVSWYGITKIEAEKYIQDSLNDFIILRIAYPYRARFFKKDDIAKRILRFYRNGQLYPMFYDQKITPTFIDDIADALRLLIAKKQNGIFHLASPKITSQYEFAKNVLVTFKQNPDKLIKMSLVSFLKQKGRTPRPLNGGLKVEKIQRLGFNPTGWQEGLKIIYAQSKGRLI